MPIPPPLLTQMLDIPHEGADPMTGRILDACYEEVLTYGIRRLSVEDVARRAGTARITIYRRFPNKSVLVRAVILREGQRLLTQVDEAVEGVPLGEQQLVEGFTVILRLLRAHPLMQRVLTTEPDLALPLATTHGAPVIAAARHYLAARLRQAAKAGRLRVRDPDQVAELLVRLTLSFILTPDSCIPLRTDDDARAFVRRHLLPAVGVGPAPARAPRTGGAGAGR
jgi:AcrR family transcriptional regulator